MANFYITLSKDEIAIQIAALLNAHNKLTRLHGLQSIRDSAVDYFVETENSKIVGCVGLVKQYNTLSLIKHLSIDNRHRKEGLATRLIRVACNNCNTDYVYMTVRDDNRSCLNLLAKLDFVFVSKLWSRDHYVLTLGRRTLNVDSGG